MKANKKTLRLYYKYIDTDWTQPVLSANGSVGGSNFACFAGSAYSTTPAWYAFDGKLDTAWASNSVGGADYIGFYIPDDVYVDNIKCYNFAWVTGEWKCYGSNDNSTYTLLASGTNTKIEGSFDISFEADPKKYKYYRINCLTTISGQRVGMGEIEINAHYRTPVLSTEEDYDYYVDTYKYYLPVLDGKYYGIGG